MRITHLLIYAVLLSISSSCHLYPDNVEQALVLSGNNKEELLKVLEHYRRKDKLKFDAACFLIGNMSYHESYTQIEISSVYLDYFNKIDSICQIDSNAIINEPLRRRLANVFDSFPVPGEIPAKPDIQSLSADYIIENIEQAFGEWQSSPLLKGMPFDEFKEWVLPYRTTDAPLSGSRLELKSLIFEKIAKEGRTDIRKPIQYYQEYVRQQRTMNYYVTSAHHIGRFDLFIPAFKMDCHNLAAITCNYFRACGIPVVCEFTPQWPDKDSKHYWCASPDSNHVFQPYTPPYNNLREDWDSNLKYAGKVYQRTYSAIKASPYFLKKQDEAIPSLFDAATIKDVTERYHTCSTVTLRMECGTSNNLAYLSFFHTQQLLNPVAWGEIDKKKQSVAFEQVPVNMLFFPTYMAEDNEIRCFGNPFILMQDGDTGKIVRKEFKVNADDKIQMHLLRKYPSKRHLAEYRQTLQGAHLLGASDWNGPYDTLLVIKNIPGPYWQEYKFNNTCKYRYYRFSPRDKLPMDIAEFEYLGKKDAAHSCKAPTALPIFSKDRINTPISECLKIVGKPMDTGPLYANFFDENSETYARWGYLGMDFGSPVCITRIRLLPRTALNMIEPGQRYQLLYFQNGKWMEHATVVSEYNYVDFDSVPAGTVYWLRNLDKGNEELPFFYEGGKQVFINQYLKRKEAFPMQQK